MTLLKQEKVPCLSDNEARLSPDPKDPFRLLTKPHGHGDVHFLLHSSGTLESWQQVRRVGSRRISAWPPEDGWWRWWRSERVASVRADRRMSSLARWMG